MTPLWVRRLRSALCVAAAREGQCDLIPLPAPLIVVSLRFGDAPEDTKGLGVEFLTKIRVV